MENSKTNAEILAAINHLKVDIFSSPQRMKDSWEGTQENECEYCGKPCGKNPLHVHIMTTGIVVPNDITEEDIAQIGQQSQGCFPIGNGCAKKLFGKQIEKYTIKFNN
ncbi:MAG TPA: hypothetical protein PLN38_14695 [Chitinophagales bacterium]|nr:hypothetical protein [Chitinophagales bacterium]